MPHFFTVPARSNALGLGNKELAGLHVLLKGFGLLNGLAAGFLGPNLDDGRGNLHAFVVWYICVFLCMHLLCVHHWS